MEREVIVSNRSVYHKYTQIKVKVPNHVKDADVNTWLQDNEDKWQEDMDKKVDKTECEFGFGLDSGMNEPESESEWRYDVLICKEHSSGGHL
jgi:hypothetical protein|tara:strand:- start:321 stop:596 length:276 start_codon:yes stop_codon:yes gene_type:complete